MRSHNIIATLAITILALGLTGHSVLAQEDRAVMKVIPPDALGFAIINHLEQTSDKIDGLAKKLNLHLPQPPLDLARTTLGITKGVNTKGSVAMAMFAGADGDSHIGVVFLPVTDYQEFIGQFADNKTGADGLTKFTITNKEIRGVREKFEILAGKKEKFAVLAEEKDRDTLKKVLASKKNLVEWSARLSGWLNQQDAAVVITPAGWKMVTALALKGLEKAKDQVGNLPMESGKVLEDMVDGVIGIVKTAETDITHVAKGVRVDKDGSLSISLQALFAPGCGWAKEAAKLKGLENGPLTGLPVGPFALAAGGAFPGSAMHGMVKFNIDALKSSGKEIPADQLKKLEEFYQDSYKNTTGVGFLIRPSKEGGLFSSVVIAMQVNDSSAYLASYEKGMRDMQQVLKDLTGGVFAGVETKKSKINGATVLETTFDFSDKVAGAEEMLKKMFGSEKLTVSIVAVNAKTVLTAYMPAAKMKDIMAAYQIKGGPGLAGSPGIAKTAAHLPPGSQWGLYINPKVGTELINSSIALFNPNAKGIPVFPDSGLIAAGVRVSANGLELRVVVPAAVLENVGPYVGKVKQANQGTD